MKEIQLNQGVYLQKEIQRLKKLVGELKGYEITKCEIHYEAIVNGQRVWRTREMELSFARKELANELAGLQDQLFLFQKEFEEL